MSFVKLNNISKSFGKTKVLNNIDLRIDSGEQVVIKGASGSGKSSLLYLMGALDKPDSGNISIDGLELNQLNDEKLALFRNSKVGFVFQFHFLLPSMNCLDNILLPSKIGEVKDKNIQSWIESLCEKLGVSHCLKKYPFEISGGEQQRINIIRALSLRPALLLCDEPTGNLDSKNSALVMELLKNLSTDIKSTLVVVTHDNKIADSFSRKITIEDGYIIS